MAFDFATAGRIRFGEGAVREAPRAAAEYGARALVVTGSAPERVEPMRADLRAAGVESVAFAVAGEPTIELVRQGVALGRERKVDLVIAFGGGSAIDAGKALAALLANAGDVLDYLEVVGRGLPLEQRSMPFIAVPTTAGTGSEVTRNAVLASTGDKVKASLRSPHMLPQLALIDPELTYDLPPAVTAATGLDALTQLIEPYVSVRANEMTDMFSRDGIPRAAAALPRAFRDGGDRDARRDMAFAALLGGLALANAGLGAVHGFAAPIGGMFPAPHGAVCAALLPHAMAANIRALRARAAGSVALARYAEIARMLTGRAEAHAEESAERVGEIVRALAIPGLAAYGVCEADVPVLVEKASRASSMKGNPIALSSEELTGILTSAL